MSNVIWTCAALGSYTAPRYEWTPEEQLTYLSVFERGYEDYKILQGILAIMVCLLCKRRDRYAKLAVPQAVDRDAVSKLESQYMQEPQNLKYYFAERQILLYLGVDLPSALKLYDTIDTINASLERGVWTYENTAVFPLQRDLYNKRFIINKGITVWLLNNGYVGPLVSWNIAFMIDDSKLSVGDELIQTIEQALVQHRESRHISFKFINRQYVQ